jgi:hypothetical protein
MEENNLHSGDLPPDDKEADVVSSGQTQIRESAKGNESGNWSSQFWANTRQVGLQFASGEELDSAIDWLWETPEMKGLPRVHVGDNSMIIPEQAVELFRKKGFQFTLRRVVSIGDLPPGEVNRIRREE